MFRTFNDCLALVSVILIVALVALNGLLGLGVPEYILGAFGAAFTLIVQYYFRKSPPQGQ